MTTEGAWTRVVLTALRKELPNTVFYKHNDRVTAGVPDVLVVSKGRHEWWEVKIARSAKVAFDAMLSPAQKAYCSKLTRAGADVYGVMRRPDGSVEWWGLGHSLDGWFLIERFTHWRDFVGHIVRWGRG